jgi:hypothetical protein
MSDAEEIEITPHMIAAGVDAILNEAGLALWDRIPEKHLARIARATFSAMLRAKLADAPQQKWSISDSKFLSAQNTLNPHTPEKKGKRKCSALGSKSTNFCCPMPESIEAKVTTQSERVRAFSGLWRGAEKLNSRGVQSPSGSVGGSF